MRDLTLGQSGSVSQHSTDIQCEHCVCVYGRCELVVWLRFFLILVNALAHTFQNELLTGPEKISLLLLRLVVTPSFIPMLAVFESSIPTLG